jgi:hypothetical protein
LILLSREKSSKKFNRYYMKSAWHSFVFILILSLGVISCDNVEKPSLINTGNTAGMQPMPVTGASAGAVSAQSATAALNPKHGEPGHRCDIAVGAPLNAAPAAATPSLNTSSAAAAPQLKSAGSVKLNPQHGQPGHRCDIAVGAPL